ncbi:unnamed protein product [Calypogeia fissa]
MVTLLSGGVVADCRQRKQSKEKKRVRQHRIRPPHRGGAGHTPIGSPIVWWRWWHPRRTVGLYRNKQHQDHSLASKNGSRNGRGSDHFAARSIVLLLLLQMDK